MTKGMEFPIGFDDKGNFRKEDLSELNHILVSGGSGFGKSNFVDSLILALIAHNGPEKVKFVMCDTKESEFSRYADMEHLLMPIATTPREISTAIGMVLSQGQKRLKEFAENRVKTISSFNDIAWENYEYELPRIVVIADDLSSVVNPPGLARGVHNYMPGRVESILSIGRAAGIHLVAATQTPAKKNTRSISLQFLSKISFYLPSKSDIRFLIGGKVQGPKSEPGEALFNNGEDCEIVHTLLLRPSDFDLIETEPGPDFIDKAAEIAIEERVLNEAKIRSRLGVGRSQAVNILLQLEDIGLIGPPDSSGCRTTLISKEQWDEAVKQLED